MHPTCNLRSPAIHHNALWSLTKNLSLNFLVAETRVDLGKKAIDKEMVERSCSVFSYDFYIGFFWCVLSYARMAFHCFVLWLLYLYLGFSNIWCLFLFNVWGFQWWYLVVGTPFNVIFLAYMNSIFSSSVTKLKLHCHYLSSWIISNGIGVFSRSGIGSLLV